MSSRDTSENLSAEPDPENGDPARGISDGGPAMARMRANRDGSESSISSTTGENGKHKSRPWYIEIPLLIVIALLLVFIFQTFVGRVYRIPSESMQPTLQGCAGCTGDRIFVDKITYKFVDPKPGDVVVFRGTDSWNAGYTSQRSANPIIRGLENAGAVIGIVPPDENDLVKRVIAVGGQTVGGCSPDGGLLVDGKPLSEPYLDSDPTIKLNRRNCEFGPVTVPDGNVWVMGDNRNNSADSRFHVSDEYQGSVPTANIVGKVRAIILPFNRISSISSPAIDNQ